MRSLYSPGQVAAGTFLGGPLAAVYLLRNNFEGTEDKKKAKKITSMGCLLVVLMSCFVVLLPENFPSAIVPILLTIAAHQYTKNSFPSKEEIQASETYQLHSGWSVFGISIGMLVIHCALIFLIVAFYDAIGLLNF